MLNKYLKLVFVVLTLFLSGCAESGDTVVLSPNKLNQKITNQSAPFILDVRSVAEYNKGHIPTANLVSYSDIGDNLDKLPQDKSTPILVYCEVGARARIAQYSLEKAGYSHVMRLDGDISAWRKQKLPMEKIE